MPDLIISHANCPDGLTAAWLMKRCWSKSAEVIFANYGDEFPFERLVEAGESQAVFITDFSYPPEVLESIPHHVTVWLMDHHRTALDLISDHPPRGWTVFDDSSPDGDAESFLRVASLKGQGGKVAWLNMNRSGAGLAYAMLEASAVEAPSAPWVEHVEDRDLWRFENELTSMVCAYIQSVPMTLEGWDALDATPFEEVVRGGIAILTREEQLIEEAVRRHWWMVISGNRVPVVDCPASICSEVGHRLCHVEGSPGWSATFRYVTINGKLSEKWSLRSLPGIEVNGVATRLAGEGYDGGGHPQSAGFAVEAGWMTDALRRS